MYSKSTINIIAIILSIFIFTIYTFFMPNNEAYISKIEIENGEIVEEIAEQNLEEIDKETQEKINSTEEQNLDKWTIEIPSISLMAKVSEGTEMATLNKYVGHFSETSLINGNVGLAAHNRGFEVNYFKDLKNVKTGDEIIYTYGEIQKKYSVTINTEISDIDWSYLKNTEENKITLITCIENKPEYRRCVQAIEKNMVN